MLPPYKLITGSDEDIEDFEHQIADALLAGYEFQGELITQPSGSSIHFFQAMTNEDTEEEFEEDEEDFEMEVDDD